MAMIVSEVPSVFVGFSIKGLALSIDGDSSSIGATKNEHLKH